ncbi:hypothetical protein SALBM217S_03733 [Streptomyces griseoloalbus]
MLAVSAEVTTATPAERSNSPPIISSATGSAMIPMVDDWYRMFAIELPSRTGGAVNRKNTRTATAPRKTPTSGRASSRSASGRRAVRPSLCFSGPGAGGVVAAGSAC